MGPFSPASPAMIETALIVAAVNLGGSDDERSSLRGEDGEKLKNLEVIYNYIREGAKAFLYAEYKICAIFIVLFGLLVLILTAHPWSNGDWTSGALTCAAFVTGAVTSIISGYVGMWVAVYSNARTTVSALPALSAGGKGQAWKGAF